MKITIKESKLEISKIKNIKIILHRNYDTSIKYHSHQVR